MRRTARGFALYAQTKDSRGNTVRVQRSSEMGVRRCWLFARNAAGNDHELTTAVGFPNGVDVVTPYLNPAQARRLAKALLVFADGAE